MKTVGQRRAAKAQARKRREEATRQAGERAAYVQKAQGDAFQAYLVRYEGDTHLEVSHDDPPTGRKAS